MQPLHVFTEEEKEKIMKAKDMVTAAKEVLAKKLGKRQVSQDNVIFEVSRFDNVIKTVEDTQKVISWVSKVDGYVAEVTDKQKPVMKYVKEAVQERTEIMESSASDIVLKSYNGAKRDLTKAVDELRAQRNEYMQKGAHPDIIKLFDAALVYAIATEEAVDSTMNVPLSTISNYIKKAESQKNTMVERMTKEQMPEPMVIVRSAEEDEMVEGDVITSGIISAPKKPIKETVAPMPKRSPMGGSAIVSKIMAAQAKAPKVIGEIPPEREKEPVGIGIAAKPKKEVTERRGVMHMGKQGRRARAQKEEE